MELSRALAAGYHDLDPRQIRKENESGHDDVGGSNKTAWPTMM